MLQCDVLLTTAAEARKWFMRMQMYMSPLVAMLDADGERKAWSCELGEVSTR
jgi:hypothetical protein